MVKYQKKIRDLREDKDLKQENIAMILKITRQQYQLYESGKRELPIKHLITLCLFYGVSADYILGFTDEPKPLPKR